VPWVSRSEASSGGGGGAPPSLGAWAGSAPGSRLAARREERRAWAPAAAGRRPRRAGASGRPSGARKGSGAAACRHAGDPIQGVSSGCELRAVIRRPGVREGSPANQRIRAR
jgi:hypothetical protein